MRFFYALLLFLCLATPAPLSAQSGETTQPSGAITVEDSAQQDAAIAVRIRDILGELDGYENVTVTVSSGIVTLRGHTLDSAAGERLTGLVSRVEGVVAIENEVSETTDLVERLDPALERFTSRISQAIAYLPLLLVALTAFAVVVIVGLLLARMRQPWDRLAPNAFIADIYRQVLRIGFVMIGIVVALDILGAVALLSTILGAAGIIGLAIGFAVRDTVENFIASILLSIRQPFRPNDTIEINGDEGNVIRLTSRATILLSFDGNHIRIPNSTVFKSRIVNYSRNRERRFTFELGIDPNADLDQATQLGLGAIEALPFVLDTPAPGAWIDHVGDSSVVLSFAGWIDQTETSLLRAKGEAIRHVKAALENAGITLPEPAYRIYMDGAPAVAQPHETPQPPAPAEPIEVGNVEASQEQAIERIVAEERKDTGADDLLSRDAPEE